MTDEELDRARGNEAIRLFANNDSIGAREHIAKAAAMLARTGWMPPDPLEAEVEQIYRHVPVCAWATAEGTKGGIRIAINRGIEIGKQQS